MSTAMGRTAIYTPLAVAKDSSPSLTLASVCCSFLGITNLTRVRRHLSAASICFALAVKDVEHLLCVYQPFVLRHLRMAVQARSAVIDWIIFSFICSIYWRKLKKKHMKLKRDSLGMWEGEDRRRKV